MGVDLLPSQMAVQKYSPDKWSPRHRLIVALHVAGLRNKEIAQQMEVSESHVSIILRDPRAELDAASLMSEVEEQTVAGRLKLLSMVAKSLMVIDSNLDSPNERVAQTAAFGVLDRTGFGKEADIADVAAQIDAEVEARMGEAIAELRSIRQSGYELLEPTIEDAEVLEPLEP